MMTFLLFVASLICYSNFLRHKQRKSINLAYAWLGLGIVDFIMAIYYIFK